MSGRQEQRRHEDKAKRPLPPTEANGKNGKVRKGEKEKEKEARHKIRKGNHEDRSIDIERGLEEKKKKFSHHEKAGKEGPNSEPQPMNDIDLNGNDEEDIDEHKYNNKNFMPIDEGLLPSCTFKNILYFSLLGICCLLFFLINFQDLALEINKLENQYFCYKFINFKEGSFYHANRSNSKNEKIREGKGESEGLLEGNNGDGEIPDDEDGDREMNGVTDSPDNANEVEGDNELNSDNGAEGEGMGQDPISSVLNKKLTSYESEFTDFFKGSSLQFATPANGSYLSSYYTEKAKTKPALIDSLSHYNLYTNMLASESPSSSMKLLTSLKDSSAQIWNPFTINVNNFRSFSQIEENKKNVPLSNGNNNNNNNVNDNRNNNRNRADPLNVQVFQPTDPDSHLPRAAIVSFFSVSTSYELYKSFPNLEAYFLSNINGIYILFYERFPKDSFYYLNRFLNHFHIKILATKNKLFLKEKKEQINLYGYDILLLVKEATEKKKNINEIISHYKNKINKKHKYYQTFFNSSNPNSANNLLLFNDKNNKNMPINNAYTLPYNNSTDLSPANANFDPVTHLPLVLSPSLMDFLLLNDATLHVTPHNVLIITKPLSITVPEYLINNFILLDRADWMKCGRFNNKKFSFDYTFYNTVFTYHILKENLLDFFDFYMKLDTDIIFNKPIPFNLFQTMSVKGCLIGHTVINNDVPACQNNSHAALLKYVREYEGKIGAKENALQSSWCKDDWFYGNFVAFWRPFLRSPENLHFANYLYEEWKIGYYKHRWTDQAVWPKFLCLFFNIKDIRNDKAICDFSWWRGERIFSHF